ncbi:MAG: hypothetical protein ACREEM_03710 [Blastocatellia bacterium]
MDAIELTTLRQELLRDTEVAESALATARERFAGAGPAQEEACAFHLCRLFNVVEQMALRVAKRFENAIDDPARWHAELIRRMTLDIPGVRPPLFPRELAAPLGELRGFRHVFTHAYDLVLRREKLALLLADADSVVSGLRGHALRFVEGVAKLHGIT